MPDELERAFLVAVDRLTRDDYGAVDGDKILAELRAAGITQPAHVLERLARRLSDDGYLADNTYFGAGVPGQLEVANVSLTAYGRELARQADPFDRTISEARRVLSSDVFAEQFP